MRTERIKQIKAEIEKGEYLTDEKIDGAAEAMQQQQVLRCDNGSVLGGPASEPGSIYRGGPHAVVAIDPTLRDLLRERQATVVSGGAFGGACL